MTPTTTIADRLALARDLLKQADDLFPKDRETHFSWRDGINYGHQTRDLVERARSLVRLIPTLKSASPEDKLSALMLLEECERVLVQDGKRELNNGLQ